MTKNKECSKQDRIDDVVLNLRKLIKLYDAQKESSLKLIHSAQTDMLCLEGSPATIGLTQGTVYTTPKLIIKNKQGAEFIYDLEEVPHELRASILGINRDKLLKAKPLKAKVDKWDKKGWFSPMEETNDE